MKLLEAIDDYVALKRSFGAIYTTEDRRLRSFARSVGVVSIEKVAPGQCKRFCFGSEGPTRYGVSKHQILKRFFNHLVARGFLTESPAESPTPRVAITFEPHVYSHAELQLLLEGSLRLDSRFHFDGHTLRSILLLLYASGLRIGEALALRFCDVDLDERILTVWKAKFFKSRLVPIGEELARSLTAHRDRRMTFPRLSDERSPFFSTRFGRAICRTRVEVAFRRVCDDAGIVRHDDQPHRPRIHDLRGTFAVHRLVDWYRNGIDVQQRLPSLSTYLGHASPSGTQRYLRMTPELLAETSKRFEDYAIAGRRGVDDV